MAHDERSEMEEYYRREAMTKQQPLDKNADVPGFLRGFLHRFQLTPAAVQTEWRKERWSTEEAIVFVGLRDWWEDAGFPYVPYAGLMQANPLRLRPILTKVFQAAAERDELERLSLLRGRPRRELLQAMGLGAYV